MHWSLLKMSLVWAQAGCQFSQISPLRQNNLAPEGDFNCFNRWSPEFIGWADHIKQIRPPLPKFKSTLGTADKSSPIVWLTHPIVLSHFQIEPSHCLYLQDVLPRLVEYWHAQGNSIVCGVRGCYVQCPLLLKLNTAPANSQMSFWFGFACWK